MAWTKFWDMHSGGGLKEQPYSKIYIEASQDEAEIIFYNRFGHNANRITCTCCGNDYSISEYESLELATAYHRGCGFDHTEKQYIPDKPGKGKYTSILDYKKNTDLLIITAEEILDSERTGDVPEQGYVWKD